jgi:hypothetical protein
MDRHRDFHQRKDIPSRLFRRPPSARQRQDMVARQRRKMKIGWHRRIDPDHRINFAVRRKIT